MADETAPAGDPFLTTALARWSTANTSEEPMRKEGEKDLQFLNLEQWEPEIVSARGDSRPCLTIDQIGEPYRQLVGQMRSSKPAIQVNPVDDKADIDTAEVFQGLIRHIEQTGHAKAAREEAFKGVVGPGWGYYRLYTEFEYDGADDPKALFDQCIKYQAIENQFTVFRDPACPLHEPWKCRFAFVIEDMPQDEFAAKYPNAATSGKECFDATGLHLPEWFPEGSVRVADYYYLEEGPDESKPVMVLLKDGTVVPLDQAPDKDAILQQRQPTKRVVKMAKISGAQILEGNDDKTGGREQPFPYIPVVPMYGEALTVKGKRTLKGIVRAARDPQRMYNYQNSELVYELALAPKSKVIMAEGQQEGYEDMWKRAPAEAFPALLYKPVSLMGQPVAPPQIAQFTDPNKIQALVVAINQHKADLRSTTGWYDSTDPNRKNSDQSGKAILARKEAQAESAVNYKYNLGQALLFEGMLLLGAIPKIYHRTGRILRLLGEDDQPIDPVTIGQPMKRKKTRPGVEGVFKWGAGRFDVVPSIGATYTTRRQEAAETQMALLEVAAKVHPPIAAAMFPSTIRQMDIPGSQDLADTAERALPPELRSDQEQDEQDPQALQAQLQQANMKMQEMGQVIQGLQEAVKTDQVKAEADLQKAQLSAQSDAQSDQIKAQMSQQDNAVKLQIEQMRIEAEFALAKMKIEADLEKARITAEAQALAQEHQLDHERGMAGAEAGQSAREGAEGREHEAAMAEQGHSHALAQEAAKPKPNGADGRN